MNNNSNLTQQRGAALFISLILLLVVTLLAVSSMRGAALEERLIGNLRDYQVTSAAADSALREGESRLATSIGPPLTSAACESGSSLCVRSVVASDLHLKDWNWWTNAANTKNYAGTASSATSIYGLSAQPRWYAAFIGFDPQNSNGTVEVTDIDERRRGVGPYYYQVNASSRSASQRVMVTLQSNAVQRY